MQLMVDASGHTPVEIPPEKARYSREHVGERVRRVALLPVRLRRPRADQPGHVPLEPARQAGRGTRGGRERGRRRERPDRLHQSRPPKARRHRAREGESEDESENAGQVPPRTGRRRTPGDTGNGTETVTSARARGNCMKLYDFGPAINAQRVRVFLAEKGLEVPTEQLNVREDHQFAEPFTSMNPFPLRALPGARRRPGDRGIGVDLPLSRGAAPGTGACSEQPPRSGPASTCGRRRFEPRRLHAPAARGAQPRADVRGEGGARHPHRPCPSSRRW